MSNNHIESEIMGLILECKVPVVSKMNYTATKGTQLVFLIIDEVWQSKNQLHCFRIYMWLL